MKSSAEKNTMKSYEDIFNQLVLKNNKPTVALLYCWISFTPSSLIHSYLIMRRRCKAAINCGFDIIPGRRILSVQSGNSDSEGYSHYITSVCTRHMDPGVICSIVFGFGRYMGKGFIPTLAYGTYSGIYSFQLRETNFGNSASSITPITLFCNPSSRNGRKVSLMK
jgi:hypothetical protein